MFALGPSLQRALLAYGAGAILAGVVTHAMSLGHAWLCLEAAREPSSWPGRLDSCGRTLAMTARVAEELEFRRLVLGIGTLAAALGAGLFMLAERPPECTTPEVPSTWRGRCAGS